MGIKTAIIGYGGMGRFHAQQIKTIDCLTIIGAYDINKDKLSFVKEDGYTAYDTLEACLNDRDIQLVIIATPNNFHKELSIKALQAGKHVLCEKPAMMNAEELREVFEVANKEHKIFTVHQNRRFDKDFAIVKKALEAEIIGRPFYIESRVQGSRGVPGDWRCVKEAGGGMLLDWGVHLLDQILQLVDSNISELYAHLLSVKFPGVDDNFKIMIKFENGTSVLVEVDTYTFIPLPRWHISTDNGTMVINDWDCNGKIVKANLVEFRWEDGIVYTSAGPTKTMAPRPLETIEELPLPQVITDCRDFYAILAEAITNGTEPMVTQKQAIRLMKVLDAVFESSTSGQCIKGVDEYEK